jgi:hypothetical protein
MFKIDSIAFARSLEKVKRQVRSATQVAVREVALQALKQSDKRAPKGFTGDLKRSRFLRNNNSTSTSGVEFGYRSRYANIMDRGFRKHIIRPIRAKALFIPRNARAQRMREAGALGPGSGLVIGRDFDLVARTRSAGPGRRFQRKGPNRYFSGTLEEFRKRRASGFTGLIARSVNRILGP